MNYSLSFLCMLFLLMCACKSQQAVETTSSRSANASDMSQETEKNEVAIIQRGTWVLQAYGSSGRPAGVLEGSKVTAAFSPESGQMSGSTGCNRYFAQYTLSDNRLQIQSPGSTERACEEPRGVMGQEQAFLLLLSTVSRYRLQSEPEANLYLECSDGQVLVFGRE